MIRDLIKLFGFQVHKAPGEAEAECAFLQREGLVDAVLSEDVDTLMFGCTKTLRSWSSDEPGGGCKSPSHVSVYDLDAIYESTAGLDREGMILVALMSGGDYLPAGITGCGPKIACEAARGGFGKALCGIQDGDAEALDQWRDELTHELRTNERGLFKKRHPAISIPGSFPSLDVLKYYTHPVISDPTEVEKLRRKMMAPRSLDINGLQAFVQGTFGWESRSGVIKFIKVLAPSLLSRELLSRGQAIASLALEGKLYQSIERIKGVCGRRCHFSTDGLPELKVQYIPCEVVQIDLEPGPASILSTGGGHGLAVSSDGEPESAIPISDSQRTIKTRREFDLARVQTAWLPEYVVRLGAPLSVEIWENLLHEKGETSSQQQPTPKKTGSIHKWLLASKKPNSIVSVSKTCPSTSPAKDFRNVANRFQLNTCPGRSTQSQHPRGRTIKQRSQSSKHSMPGPSAELSTQKSNGTTRTCAGSQMTTRITKSVESSEETFDLRGTSSKPPYTDISLIVSNVIYEQEMSSADSTWLKNYPRTAKANTERSRKQKLTTNAKDVPRRQCTQIPITNYITVSKDNADIYDNCSQGRGKRGIMPEQRLRSPDRLGAIKHHHLVSVQNRIVSPMTAPAVLHRGQEGGCLREKLTNRQSNCNSDPTVKTTRLLVPRVGSDGFFDEIDIDTETADMMIKVGDAKGCYGRKERIWQLSQISMIDMASYGTRNGANGVSIST
jgi:hypothetical protein